MDTPTKIRVLERMRELLSDPERVVLNPMHYYETADGEEGDMTARDALRGVGCRVCFCGAASVAALEIIGTGYSGGGRWHDVDEDIRTEMADKIDALGIPLDAEVELCYGSHNSVSALTSALKLGRAVEVVDAVLADVRAGA